MSTLNLSNIQPDYEGIRAQLQAALSQKNAWVGVLPTQTGQTLIDLVAAVGAFAQAKSMRYAQDAYKETAISDRALYAIAEMQGNRLRRKIAAGIQVTASYVKPNSSAPNTITLPAFTQFQAAGTYWYSKTPVIVNTGGSEALTLYQGYILDQETTGLGTPFQTFVSKETGFTVSDVDVFVYVNNTLLQRSTTPLWKYKGEPAYQDKTTPDGRLRLLFGNATYGYMPQSTDLVRIVYAVTSGMDGNSIGTLTSNLVQTNNQIAGVSLNIESNPQGGSNEPPASNLKTVGAIDYGSFDQAVTPSQHKNIALDYPGIVDARTLAQREIDPTNLALMNTIKVYPLTSSVWTQSQYDDYLADLQSRSMFSPIFYKADPLAVPRTVYLKVFCFNWANLGQCQADAQGAVQALFAPRKGILGFDISLSDIDRVVRESNKGIDYIEIYEPTASMNVSGRPQSDPVITLDSAPGTLTPMTYSYGIGVVDSLGTIAPLNFASITVLSGNSPASLKLKWNKYPNALSYLVYGRAGGAYGLIAALPPTALEFVDNGSITPTGSIPTVSSYPVAYNTLASCTVEAEYATRKVV